jgi:hypothetical protein
MNLFGWFRKANPPPIDRPKDAASSPSAPAAADPTTGAPPAAPSPAEIRQQLFDAIAAGDDERLEALCDEHRDLILSHGPRWLQVPESFRSSPDAYRWYEEGLHAIARFCSDKLPRPSVSSSPDLAPPPSPTQTN